MHSLIVGPTSSGLLYFDAAREMGMEITGLTTGTGNLALSDEVRERLEGQLVIVKSLDVDAFVGAACRLNKIHPIDGVLAGDELMVEHAAVVADVLGLPFISPDDVAGVRDKAEMRRRLQAANVRVPKFVTATSAIDLEKIAGTVGFPAVIKPLSMAGSVGVVRVDNTVELLAAYEDIVNDEGGWGVSLGTKVIVEEFLEGVEYNADGFVTVDGEIHVFEFGEYVLGPQPHFQVIGSTAQRGEDLPEGKAIIEYVRSVVRALDIPVGPFHAELMLTATGPVLIEIANRLPGAHFPELGEMVTGISFAKSALAVATRSPLPGAGTPRTRVAGVQYIVAPLEYLGKTYTHLSGWDGITEHNLVDEVNVDIRPGELIPPHPDERSWIASVRFHADSVEEAASFRAKLLETVHVAG